MGEKRDRCKKLVVGAITVLPISGAMVVASGGTAHAAIGNAFVGSQLQTAAVGNAHVLSESTAIGNAFSAVVAITVDLGGPAPS